MKLIFFLATFVLSVFGNREVDLLDCPNVAARISMHVNRERQVIPESKSAVDMTRDSDFLWNTQLKRPELDRLPN